MACNPLQYWWENLQIENIRSSAFDCTKRSSEVSSIMYTRRTYRTVPFFPYISKNQSEWCTCTVQHPRKTFSRAFCQISILRDSNIVLDVRTYRVRTQKKRIIYAKTHFSCLSSTVFIGCSRKVFSRRMMKCMVYTHARTLSWQLNWRGRRDTVRCCRNLTVGSLSFLRIKTILFLQPYGGIRRMFARTPRVWFFFIYFRTGCK